MERNELQRIAKLCVFVAIANLPFITITQLIDIDTFIDSFHHPESYHYIKNDRIDIPSVQTGYLVLEKPTNQDYQIEQGDIILYYSPNNELQQQVVCQILYHQGMKTYYTTIENQDILDGPIYDQQIIGKIKGNLDENVWNALCLQLWDISIDRLNVVALFSSS